MKKPKDYKQFERAIELCNMIEKECPAVSVILNCHIRLREGHYIFGLSDYNLLTKEKKAIVIKDRKRKFIVFNGNEVVGSKVVK